MIIGGNGDSIYTRLMTAVGRPDMGSSNPLYKSNSDRCRHEKEIYAVSQLRFLGLRQLRMAFATSAAALLTEKLGSIWHAIRHCWHHTCSCSEQEDTASHGAAVRALFGR